MASRLPIPNLAAIHTIFTARMYNWDMMLIYRALSGKYSTYFSLMFAGAGVNFYHDLVTTSGAIGPFSRLQYVGSRYHVSYLDILKPYIEGKMQSEFWEGWEAYRQLLLSDAESVGEPLRFPPLSFAFPKVDLAWQQLPASERVLYGLYIDDIVSFEILMSLLTEYIPETIPSMPTVVNELEGMFQLYTEWANERWLGRTASNSAKIMAKTILIADYRWYFLLGDLLAQVKPELAEPSFTNGIAKIAEICRAGAESIRV